MRTKTLATVSLMVLGLGSLSSMWPGTQANADTYRRYGWSRSSMTVREGTPLEVRLDSKISTDEAQPGDTWSGTVNRSVVTNNRIAIPAGSPVSGVVTSSTQGTHNERPSLSLAVREVTVDGRSYTVNAESPPIVAGTNRAKKAGAIVGGAAAGALLGHAVAKRSHGTLIGGVLGGAAGYGLTRHALRTMQLKPGAVVTFTTTEDLVARRY